MTRIEGGILDLEYNTYCLKFASKQNKGARSRDSERNKVYLAESKAEEKFTSCLLYTSPSPRDGLLSRMPSSA